jgi:hypothetical protein
LYLEREQEKIVRQIVPQDGGRIHVLTLSPPLLLFSSSDNQNASRTFPMLHVGH